jgi:hypothetical protein
MEPVMAKTALMMLAVTSTLVLSGMGRANAATITATYDFTITDFTPAGSPVDPWSGSFTITYDPTAAGGLGPLALDVFSSNLPASYGTFEYSQGSTFVFIGDKCVRGGCLIPLGTDSAALDFIPDASGGVAAFGIGIIASPSLTTANFLSETGTVAVTALPAALPLFTTGLGALGLLGWRRKRKARVSLLGVG